MYRLRETHTNHDLITRNVSEMNMVNHRDVKSLGIKRECKFRNIKFMMMF